MQNRKDPSQNYTYRVRFKFSATVDATMHTDDFNRALEIAAIQMKTHTPANCRTGSLRGDGKVDLWQDGEKVGWVTIEKYVHGQYVLIGG